MRGNLFVAPSGQTDKRRQRTSALRKLRSLGDGLPSGSNRPQNPPVTDTLSGPAKRSYVEAVQRCNQALGDYQSACAGLDPRPARARDETTSLLSLVQAREGATGFGRLGTEPEPLKENRNDRGEQETLPHSRGSAWFDRLRHRGFENMHIGLIGGIGPAATDFYYRRLISTFASKQAALDLTIVHADTPTLLGNLASNNAAAQVAIYMRLTKRLATAGAGCVVVTSIAGHFCIADFKSLSPLPVIDMISEVNRAIEQRGLRRIGILGTRTVMETRFTSRGACGDHPSKWSGLGCCPPGLR